MRVLFVSAEVAPYAKVGGLGDVAASLPQALAALGHEVRVVTPDHGGQQRGAHGGGRARLAVPAFGRDLRVTLVERPGPAPVWLVSNARFFGRAQVYGQPDDLLRYHFFCSVVLALPRHWGWVPDILHCNDWHTAFLPFGLRNLAWADAGMRATASVLTIHNLVYRGPDDLTDVLAQGIYYADVVNTVSPTYAREIASPEQGHGLDPLLRLRGGRLYGILNGLDQEVFDPRRDAALAARYGPDDPTPKAVNKAAVQHRLGLHAEPDRPLVGIVSRIDYQKGTDLVAAVLPRAVRELSAQFAIIGSGAPALEQALQEAVAQYPGAAALLKGYHPDVAPLVYAGADLFLMPSRSEPCGLGQLIAMRYGTVPVVRHTGGLADTVADADADPENGTGFVFGPYDAEACFDALARAVRAYHQPQRWEALRRRVMLADHSWERSAQAYVAMYAHALEGKGA